MSTKSKSKDRLSEELTHARKKLADALGVNMTVYLQFMKSWLKKKISTEELDAEARSLMTPEYADANGCGVSRKERRSKERPGIPSTMLNSEIFRRFIPADPLSHAPQVQTQPLEPGASMPEYASSDLFLPDNSLIHGRMLVAAWEHGLEAIDDDCVQITVHATEIFMKNILMALACHTQPFAMKGTRFRYGIGSRRLLPSAPLLDQQAQECDDNLMSVDFSEDSYTPRPKLTPTLAEQEAAVKLSRAGGETLPGGHHVTLFDLLELLQSQKNIIHSHTIYTLLIERVINRMSHPTREEEEEEMKLHTKKAPSSSSSSMSWT